MDTKLAASGRKPDEEREQAPRHGYQGLAPLPLLPPAADRRPPARGQRRDARRSRHPRPRARPLHRARAAHGALRRHRLLVAALARRPPRVAAVPDPGHRARLPPGRALRPSRASRGSRARRLVADPRCADHPLGRIRHRLRLHDDGADPDRGRHVLARDRAAARRLLVVRARADEGRGHSPEGRPRRRGSAASSASIASSGQPAAGSATSSSAPSPTRRSRICRSSARRSPSSRRSSSGSHPTS